MNDDKIKFSSCKLVDEGDAEEGSLDFILEPRICDPLFGVIKGEIVEIITQTL